MTEISFSDAIKLLSKKWNANFEYRIFCLKRENNTDYGKSRIFDDFFISIDIYWWLHETNYENIFILKQHWTKSYIIICDNYDHILLHHFSYDLKNTVNTYIEYNNKKNVKFSWVILKNIWEQISVYEAQCNEFIKRYAQNDTYTYSYIQELRQLINNYAGIKTSLAWNAESLYDSLNSNNYLLLWVEDLSLSSYARVKSSHIKNYEKYVSRIIGFPHENKAENFYLTSSWMKAISLVIQHLIKQKNKQILIIWNIYFETIKLLENYFWVENISYFSPERNIANLPEYLTEKKPQAVFLDTTTLAFETYSFSQKDFQQTYEYINSYNKDIDIIIDSTTKYIYAWNYCIPKNLSNNCIHVGSLWKYLYAGMDLGFWWYIHTSHNIPYLSSMFSNSGTGISHFDTFKIPIIPKSKHQQIIKLLHTKIENIQNILAEKSWNINYSKVLFPKVKKNNFYTNLINISVDKNSKEIIWSNKDFIVQSIIKSAKKYQIDVSYSTSYGYYNTRFSIFMCNAVKAIPIKHPYYIRISVGYTSKESEIVKLILIIEKILTYTYKNM